MFKRILVALCDQEHCSSVIQQAILIARREQAQILGSYVIDQRELIPPPDTITQERWRAEVEPELKAIGQKLLDKLTDECWKADVPVETRLLIGQPAKVICRLGYTTDLIVIGRHGEYAHRGGLLGCQILEGVVRLSTRPVLIAGDQARTIERIMVAYDGTAAASVALSVAARLATEWCSPLVMSTVLEKKVDRSVVQEGMTYLQPYGFPEKALLLDGVASEEIIRVAAEESIDLIVMGAYCHGRVREYIASGTLGQVVRGCDRPALVCC